MVNGEVEARGVRLGTVPFVSLVVASRSDAATVEKTLWDMALECSGVGVELVVARAGDTAALDAIFPEVRFVAAPAGADAEALRALGVTAAQGDIVAFTEDDTAVPVEWLTWLNTRRSDRIRIEQEQPTIQKSAPETERTGKDA